MLVPGPAMNLHLPALLAILLLLVILATLPWSARYNRARLAQARGAMEGNLAARGWRILSAKLCWLPAGPFALAIACHDPVFRVAAQDASGRVHRGWIRCRPFSGRVESAWEGP